MVVGERGAVSRWRMPFSRKIRSKSTSPNLNYMQRLRKILLAAPESAPDYVGFQPLGFLDPRRAHRRGPRGFLRGHPGAGGKTQAAAIARGVRVRRLPR